MGKKLLVGFDFDGVIAYNPARLVRFPISYVKSHVLGIRKVSFFVPKTPFQRTLWALAHESSMFPSRGVGLLRTLVSEGEIEAHLVTGRFGFLRPDLERFLKRWDLADLFTSVTLNEREEQPHLFKASAVRRGKFDVYVEDNWDIVHHLSETVKRTKVCWIYNLFDRHTVYPHKYPYLEKALEAVMPSPISV